MKKNIGTTKKQRQKSPNRTQSAIKGKISTQERPGEITPSKRYSSWTPEEIAILQQHYPTQGVECQKYLPNRSKNSVQIRAKLMGIKKLSSVWSLQENEILKKNSQLTPKALQELLPGRTTVAIANQMARLESHEKVNKPWSSEEDAILRRYYPTEGPECGKRLPNYRTHGAVAARAIRLAIKRNLSVKQIMPWSTEELDIIKKNLNLNQEALQKLFPGRTQSAVLYKREDLKKQLKKRGKFTSPRQFWTADEDAILQHYYPIEGLECKKRLPNRTREAIASRIAYLARKRQETETAVDLDLKTTPWSQEEIDILKKNIELDPQALQKFFPDKTQAAILDKQKRLKKQLKRRGELPLTRHYWTPDEDAILRRYYPIEGSECKKRLSNRKREAIRRRAVILGIKFETQWSQQELEILKENFYLGSNKALQKLLPNRTISAIEAKKVHLNRKRKKD